MENIYERLCESIPVFAGAPSSSVVAYLNGKYKEKEDAARLKYNASFLTTQLELFQRQYEEELAYYNRILTKFTNQFLSQSSADDVKREVTISIILFDADTRRTNDEEKLLDFACQAFYQMFLTKGYPPLKINEKDEYYKDFCEGTCLRRTRFITIPLI